MKFCQQCGRQTDDSSIVCPFCGKSFTSEYAAPSSPASNYFQSGVTDSTPALICGILSFFVLRLVLAIVAIYLANANAEQNGGVMGPNAKAGRVCGIINLCLSGVGVFLVIIYFVFFAAVFGSIYA